MKIDDRIVVLLSLDLGGFLITINIIIVAQNKAKMAQPVIKA